MMTWRRLPLVGSITWQGRVLLALLALLALLDYFER